MKSNKSITAEIDILESASNQMQSRHISTSAIGLHCICSGAYMSGQIQTLYDSKVFQYLNKASKQREQRHLDWRTKTDSSTETTRTNDLRSEIHQLKRILDLSGGRYRQKSSKQILMSHPVLWITRQM